MNFTTKNSLAPIFILLLLTFSAFAQNPRPTPAPTQTPADDETVTRISTTLIQIDVTVTDKKGNLVKDLKPEDFEVFENGVKQNVTNFSFISNVKTTTEKLAPDKNALPAPPAEISAEQIRRTIALVVDDITLSFESVYYVRRALKKFVDEQMQDGDLVAIVRTGANTGALQQFTSDKRLLYAAIENVRWNPNGRGGISAFAPIQDDGFDEEENSEQPADAPTSPDARKINPENYRNEVLVSGSLGSLRYIIGGMSELPGRKSVILFSDGFQLFTKDDNGMVESSGILNAVRRVIDAAYRSSVVIYALDARGLQPAGITAADRVGSNPQQISAALSARRTELFDTQQGLGFLAEQTGGFAVTNNNDLNFGVRRILDDQSYYLLGYQPDDETFDAQKRRFNKLEIKINRKDVKVRYRSGFFNVSDERVARPVTNNQTPAQQITGALVSPFAANDISLRLNTLFGNNANGSFVRSLLHVSAKDLKFTDEPDGVKKAVFDVLAISFGDNGNPVEQIAKTYTLRVKSETFKEIIADGFVYYFTFPVKKDGAYQFRVALRDSQTGKLGSASQFIEVPNLKKSRLTVSGIVLENLTFAQWQKLSGEAVSVSETKDGQLKDASDPMTDTSLRRFKRGTVLRYGFEIYNAKLDQTKNPQLTTQIRIFRDGKLILDGKQNPLSGQGQTDLQRIKSAGAISLADKMEAGDYILQIVVADNSVKGKRKIATQSVQFQIVE